MRAVVVNELIGPDGTSFTEDAPEPEGAHPAANGQRLLVEVHAAGIAWPDLLQSKGEYQISVPPPFVSGGEIAGIVKHADPETGFQPGDRVAGMSVFGAMAETALAVPGFTIKLADGVDFAAGAALWLNYSTALFAIQRASVTPEDVVLVHGAAGGVGTAALDLLRANPTIAVVSSDAKAEAATGLGATHVVRSDGDWLAETKELTGGHGVDVVLDPVGGDRFTDSLRSLDHGGRLVVIGFTGGSIPTVKVNRLLLRNLTVIGVGLGAMDVRFPGTVRRIGDEIARLAAEHTIEPLISRRLPLEDGAEALRILERREAIGKVVVDVR
jgi:NADPH2:quinone reductase